MSQIPDPPPSRPSAVPAGVLPTSIPVADDATDVHAASGLVQPSRPDDGDAAEADEPTAVPLRIEDVLTVAVMGLLALITFGNVVARYFTSQSFAWTEEFSIFLMIVLAMVAGSAAVARDRHIRIEYLAARGSAGRRRALAVLAAGLTSLAFAVLAVLSARMVWDDYRYEETSPALGLPQWWYSMWLPLLSAAIASRVLGLAVRRWRQPPPEVDPLVHGVDRGAPL